MLIELIRHGETEDNREKRYQGARDVPLSPMGRRSLCRAELSPETVYVSPLSRAVETAALLFPNAKRVLVPELREMSFGVFEGRNYREMEHDADYRAWVAGGCLGKCPGGESRAEFCARTCGAFEKLVDSALENGEERMVVVAHGGTQMAVLERLALPKRDYFSWRADNGCGFLLDTAPWEALRRLKLLDEVKYRKDRIR